MLEMTDTQAKIIEQFIEYDATKYGDTGYGLTAGQLGKKITLRTFQLNVDKMLQHYLLRLNRIETHGTSKKKHWKYYQLTIYGVLAYLKWRQKHDFAKSITLTKKFFPILGKHWGKLCQQYGKILDYQIQEATSQIDLEKYRMSNKSSKQVLEFASFKETISLYLGALEIRLHRDIGDLEKQQLLHPTRNKKLDQTFDENINHTLDKTIQDHFTFLLFFNLINLAYDVSSALNLSFKLFPPFTEKNGKTHINYTEHQLQIKASNLDNKLKKGSKIVILMINGDDELHRIFKTTLTEVITKLKSRKTLNELNQKIK